MWRARRVSLGWKAVLSTGVMSVLRKIKCPKRRVWGKHLNNFKVLGSYYAVHRAQSVSFAKLCSGYDFSMSKKVTLRDLFPGETEEQIERIADFLHGYCTTIWRIYERPELEHPEVIDALMKNRSMKGKVDSSNKTN